ncbi:MAG TPA: beta-xylosidase, partial [Cyclobacteriaceae bacterium]
FRDLATNGVDKPVLNVFRMFGMMKGKRVATEGTRMYALDNILTSSIRQQTDIGSLASKDEHSAAVMIWNYHDEDKQAPAEQIQVTLNGLPSGSVKITHYRIDNEHSNSYEVWKKMGSPQNPTAEQIATLEKAGQLQTVEEPVTKKVKANNIVMNISLPRQGVSFLKIDW